MACSMWDVACGMLQEDRHQASAGPQCSDPFFPPTREFGSRSAKKGRRRRRINTIAIGIAVCSR